MGKRRKTKPKARKAKNVVKLGPDLFYRPRRFIELKKAMVVRLGRDIQECYATCH